MSQEGTAPELVEKITRIEAREGDVVKFQCRVRGRPASEMEWYKDEQLLEESEKVKFETQDGCHRLIIRNVSLNDEAEYKALARNPVGTAACTAELLVEEAVDKPELLEPMTDVQVASLSLVIPILFLSLTSKVV